MKTLSFEELLEICDEHGGISVSLAGYGDIEEIRIMALACPDDSWRANWARMMNDGEIVFGGIDGCVFENDAESALANVLERGCDIDDAFGFSYDIYGVRAPYDPSRAELVGGPESWDGYEYGSDLI